MVFTEGWASSSQSESLMCPFASCEAFVSISPPTKGGKRSPPHVPQPTGVQGKLQPAEGLLGGREGISGFVGSVTAEEALRFRTKRKTFQIGNDPFFPDREGIAPHPATLCPRRMPGPRQGPQKTSRTNAVITRPPILALISIYPLTYPQSMTVSWFPCIFQSDMQPLSPPGPRLFGLHIVGHPSPAESTQVPLLA